LQLLGGLSTVTLALAAMPDSHIGRLSAGRPSCRLFRAL
jgi:hypothetical protein